MVFLGKRHPVSKATNHPRETKHQRPSRFLGRAKLFSPHHKVWVGGAKYLISPPCRRPARSPQGGRSALINALLGDLRESGSSQQPRDFEIRRQRTFISALRPLCGLRARLRQAVKSMSLPPTPHGVG